MRIDGIVADRRMAHNSLQSSTTEVKSTTPALTFSVFMAATLVLRTDKERFRASNGIKNGGEASPAERR